MASWRTFQPRPTNDEPSRDTGTKQERPCGRPFNGVGHKPRPEYEGAPSGNPESCGVDRREKLDGELAGRPYRKPTQVGEASSLR